MTRSSLDRSRRAAPFLIEPSREAGDALDGDTRGALCQSGALSGPAVTMQSLANKGLTRAEGREPLSHNKGDVIWFARDGADKGVTPGEAYHVESDEPAKAAVTIKSEDWWAVDWRLRQWGAGYIEAFSRQSLKLKTERSIRFTRNDREAGRTNGARGEVTAIDEQAHVAIVRNPRD